MFNSTFNSFAKRLTFLAIPMILQSLLFSSLGFIDTLMISQLSTADVAASGIGARIFWLTSIIIWATGSGLGVLLAQYWGAKDEQGFKSSMAIGLSFALLLSFLFFLVCMFMPMQLAGLMSNDLATINLASQYLQVISIAILLSGLSITQDASLRAIGKPHIGLYTYIVELIINVSLSYILIFGEFGAPQLGLVGAGIGSVVARIMRIALVFFVIAKYLPILKITKQHFSALLDKQQVDKFLQITLPVGINGIVWGGGIFVFNIIIGNMGQTELAVITLITPLEAIALAVVTGVSGASSTILGHTLGTNDFALSKRYSKYALACSVSLGLITATLYLLIQPLILYLYGNLDSDVIELFTLCFPLIALSIVVRAANITMIVGILRSGGDTKFCMKLDVLCQWCWAIPLTALAAFYFELPLYYVYFAIISEELVKVIPAARRIWGDKWLRNLTQKESVLA